MTSLDTEKEKECEYCSAKTTAKEYDAHLESCEAYQDQLKSDIGKNKFKEVIP